ncbi:MAG: bifunctional hydroxymethylpyrimidine kinase/phosphomethylpyrimidine kinase [Acidobacteriia bacterium]|nr:bifunctional hydroxymethylpyrimidine kinase/phosphomethylpyrimidine kinase [Terriglobia bacterium]
MSQSIETTRPVVLTIAGFDPSCGAGIAADLKTISACGAYGIAAITALTIQNTVGVNRVIPIEPLVLIQQIEYLIEDIRPAAVKIGMLATKENVEGLRKFLLSNPLSRIVIDPVIRSSSGSALLTDEAIDVFKTAILPLADCLTPNISEAEILSGLKVRNVDEMKKAAERIVALGSKAVVITGGHLIEPTDVLFDGATYEIFAAERVGPSHTHGTGCTFSSALATFLALGCSLKTATANAKNYVTRAIQRSYPIGRGRSPLNHFPDY